MTRGKENDMIYAKMKKLAKDLMDMEYPGGPFQCVVATDGKGKCSVNGREYKEAALALADLNGMFTMQIVGSHHHCPAGGVDAGTLGSLGDILRADDEDFYIADWRAAKAWLAAHAIVERPQNGPAFLFYDEEDGFLIAKEGITEETLAAIRGAIFGEVTLDDLPGKEQNK